MLLGSGSRFGQYEVETPLGAGAMGEVYRARDPRLGRHVALKVLQSVLNTDPGSLSRFDREARALAAIQHPHVASIYGVEESGSVRALVMELVDGETLAVRLSRGPLAWRDALRIGGQIASALEAVHERGIIHRDLKPVNIQVTRTGTVKVLDFGLARLLDHVGPSLTAIERTMTADATQAGTILGTAAYMSPEQVRGEAADVRSDIWALGCILYEMLCGRRPFGGSTAVESLAATLERDPDWSRLPQSTPSGLRKLLRRCLQKDPLQRMQHAGDVRLEIDDIVKAPDEPAISQRANRWRSLAAVATAVALVLLVPLARNFRRAGDPGTVLPFEPVRASIGLPADLQLFLNPASILSSSPDGTTFVFSATRAARTQLYRRKLNGFSVDPIPDTDGGDGPFFSPDGQWIGFFAHGYMKKVATTGGAAVTIAAATDSRGAAWLEDGTIVFTPEPDVGMSRVSATGGPVSQLTTTDMRANEIAHRWPGILPGRKAILFTVYKGVESDSIVSVLDLDNGQHKVIVTGGTSPHFVADAANADRGDLVYVHDRDVFAAPFDLRRLEVVGPPRHVETGARQTNTGATALTVSRTATMVYASGDQSGKDGLVWVNPHASERVTEAVSGPVGFPRLSSDGKRVAVSKLDGGNYDVWTYEFGTAKWSRVTLDAAFDAAPVWSPDDSRIAFRSFRGQPMSIFSKPADLSAAEQRITSATRNRIVHAWTRTGFLIYSELDASGRSLWIVPADASRPPKVLLQGLHGPVVGAPSPDNKWLAYTTDESGVPEVFVVRFDGQGIPASSAPRQVSLGGGIEPVWSRDARELFYRGVDQMMVARIDTTTPPMPLFADRYKRWGDFVSYAVAPDGRFLMTTETEPRSLDLKVVTGAFRH